MDVSIIIVNFNTLNDTKNCIESIIEKTSGISYEIILVDNGSIDGSKEYFEKDKRIRYIYLFENLGFGKANNEGTKFAQGKYLFFLNPDTLLINNAIKILSDYLNDNPKCGICGGNLYTIDLKPNHSFLMFRPGIIEAIDEILHYYPSRFFYRGNFRFNRLGKPYKVKYITGADLMIPKEIFKRIGGFNPLYFMYYEDPDLCFRVNKLGYDIVSVPNAKIIHLAGQSLKNDSKAIFQGKLFGESLNIYLKYNFSLLHKNIAKYLYLLDLKLLTKRNKKKTEFYRSFYINLKNKSN